MRSRRGENCGVFRSCSSWCDGKAFLGRVHRYTARGDPRHQGGEGVAGTPGACSQVFCHPIRCMSVMRYRQRYVINTQSELQPPQPPQPPQEPRSTRFFFAHSSGATSFVVSLAASQMMAGGEVDGEGAARRRRQRRLRSWLKHERQSVAMALAEYTHHASRGQTRARAREEAGSETYYAPRGLKTLPPGTRPAPLSEVSEPQVGAVTVGYVAASRTPSLATPSLADSAGDAVDAAALEFLVWAAFKTPEQIERSKQASWRKQRKEAAKREKELAKVEEEASSSQASSSQRRRKMKKKKKKLPKTQVSVRSCSSSTGRSSSWRRGRSSWSVVAWWCYFWKLLRIQRISWFDIGYNICVSLQRLCGDYFWKMFRIHRISWFDIGYNICVSLRSFLGDDFVEMFVFSVCGSTVDTRSLVYFTIFYVKVDTARAVRTGVWTYLSALYPAVPCSVSAVTVITPVIHYCMGGLACGELCSSGPRFSSHLRSVRCGVVLGQGCSCPLLGNDWPSWSRQCWMVLHSWEVRGVSRVTSVSSAARAVRTHVVSLRYWLVQVPQVQVVWKTVVSHISAH